MTPKRLILDDKNRVAQWVLDRHGDTGARWGSMFECIGIAAGGRIVAAAVFSDYVPGGSLEIHFAAEPGATWACRDVLRAGFRYAFQQCNVRSIRARIAEKNWRSQRLAARLGFVYEGTAKNALPDQDELIYGLLRENCRYLA